MSRTSSLTLSHPTIMSSGVCKSFSSSPSMATPARPTCQIYGKSGHVALNCWHRCNFKYVPTAPRPPRAFLASPSATTTQEWVLDSGASTHFTQDGNNLHSPAAYQGSDTMSIANGTSLSIHNSSQGLLPLPDTPRKLRLSNLLHVP
ncbi:hypothetical protein KFK09_027099 [Dendrobium nobile]|uniref:Retrovirus-related Pol polyprotein from transposon TNT 1-94-like beta-barrel domain-containing protein n=1 Tax=Dendrobium nobile TaxID=94219 RepID=A0A8T3A9R3_DENNO|nr:hypothetical protein KFK09_027099 [Dendrobium nobile]